MLEFDTHVCIVSGEPLPNFLPAISKEVGRKKIVLLESPVMQAKADTLEAVLKDRGCEVKRYPIDDKSNLALFRDQVQNILTLHPNAALNATGGMKTMSIVAHEVFRNANRPVFYSERDNRIIWLNPVEADQQRLPGMLTIDDYLKLFNQSILKIERKPLTDDGGISMLARINTLPKGNMTVNTKLESLVFRAASNALQSLPQQGLTDVAWGVSVGGESTDEFDVVIIRNNILYLIECKNVSNTNGFNHFLNKLEALKRKRGITAKAALVATIQVAKDGGNAERAKNTQIELWDETCLPQLTDKLKHWLSRI